MFAVYLVEQGLSHYMYTIELCIIGISRIINLYSIILLCFFILGCVCTHAIYNMEDYSYTAYNILS